MAEIMNYPNFTDAELSAMREEYARGANDSQFAVFMTNAANASLSLEYTK